MIGFWFVHLIVTRQDLVAERIAELLGAVASGELEVVIGEVYPLSEAAARPRGMQARRTQGKLLLDPTK